MQQNLFSDEKVRAENVEYMTRMIFLGGNPNRRQDIFKSCRRVPGPSEHANLVQKCLFYHGRFRVAK